MVGGALLPVRIIPHLVNLLSLISRIMIVLGLAA
jgi:hypothetical protein